ncbi:hypothetical protein STEG23_007991, partial [Scotinomys teguina]
FCYMAKDDFELRILMLHHTKQHYTPAQAGLRHTAVILLWPPDWRRPLLKMWTVANQTLLEDLPLKPSRVILALRMLEQEDCYKFKAILSYIVGS